MRILFKWLVLSLVIFAIPQVISGVYVADIKTALAASAVLSVLNLLLRPVLVFFTFPLTILTLGLFLFFINALMFYLAAYFVKGFIVDSFIAALLASLIVSVVSWLMNVSRSTTSGLVIRGGQRYRELN